MATWLKRHLTLVFAVVLPTCLAVLYYGFLASDVFISESRFLVRSPQHRMEGGFVGQLLQGSGITHSQDDNYSVHDYILSRDALRELDTKLGLRTAFTSKRVDPVNRFAGLSRDDSFEEFYRYYGRHVGVEYDPASSISTLTVHAFTAQDAETINAELLQMSELLVNTLNERSRKDLIRYAADEVRIANDKATAAAVALFDYRSKHAVFEPDKQAAIQLEGVAKIQGDLISTEAQLAQVQKLSPDNPQIPGLQSRTDTLRRAIASEAAKVTSANGSFSARAPDFERLTLETAFAAKQLGVALADLEGARSEALRQQLYLERLVRPNLPDRAMEPRRIRSMFTVFLVGMIAWGVASLLIAAIREHSD